MHRVSQVVEMLDAVVCDCLSGAVASNEDVRCRSVQVLTEASASSDRVVKVQSSKLPNR